MKCYYDLHIHTALSPCASDDMTPNNIVNMAILKELDFIAITDHNSVRNLKVTMECARDKNIIVIPGIEVESSEEVHLLCYFSNLESALSMGEMINNHLPNIKNRPEIFGAQIICDAYDEAINNEERLLMTATSLSIDKIITETKKLGGVTVPSHVDRTSYSIISNLGFIPSEYEIRTVEISKASDYEIFLKKNHCISNYNILINSDAHNLGDISERVNYIEIKEKNIKCFLDLL